MLVVSDLNLCNFLLLGEDDELFPDDIGVSNCIPVSLNLISSFFSFRSDVTGCYNISKTLTLNEIDLYLGERGIAYKYKTIRLPAYLLTAIPWSLRSFA